MFYQIVNFKTLYENRMYTKHSLFLLPFVVFITLTVSAQENKDLQIREIDSLLNEAHQGIWKVDVEQTVVNSFNSLKISEEIDYSSGRARAYFYIAQSLTYTGRFQEALDYLQLSEKEEYTTTNSLIQFEICRIRGQIYAQLKLDEQSLKSFKHCVRLAKQLSDDFKINYCLSLSYENLAIVYKNIGNPDSVLYFLKENQKVISKLPDDQSYPQKVNLYASLGEHFIENNNFKLAESYFQKSIAVALKYDFPYLSRTYSFYGDLKLKSGEPDSALHYYRKSLDNLRQTNLKAELPKLLERMSDYFGSIGLNDSAKHYRDEKILIENELAQEKVNSAKNALELLLKEEQALQKKSLEFYLLAGALLLIVTSFGIYFSWKRKHTKVIVKNEEETSQLKMKLNESFDEVEQLAKSNSPLFFTRFREVYPELIQNITDKHPELSVSDLTLCAYVFLNYSSKDIASFTFVQHRSIQTRKSRLRKKLGLSLDEDLHKYILSFC